MGTVKFTKNEEFTISNPENYSGLYFPIARDNGIKSCVTPNLGGDAKHDQNSFLLEPVSIMNLHNNRGVRNIWVNVEGKGVWSAVGASAAQESRRFTKEQDESSLEAGYMWHKLTRKSKEYAVSAELTSFVPIEPDVELLHVKLTNTSSESQKLTVTAAVPIYGRSADNIRDHRHVTSLLHRISTNKYCVSVKPTLSFDERGHKKNDLVYFVGGTNAGGEAPEDFYPDTDSFIGEGGTLIHPRSIYENKKGAPSGTKVEGKEAMGGLHFKTVELKPNESVSYTVVMGITDSVEKAEALSKEFSDEARTMKALKNLKAYWTDKVNVSCHTGSRDFDGLMNWVSFQPFLRRIYGCSFLPHHDYGRGGRGWRDLWQDCLSLLIMDPDGVRDMILDNYGGVRIDGTNATIIGENRGEFIADRNGIARVWMDHGVWPFMTTKLYIDQTGDAEVLLQEVAYFKDEQSMRGQALDKEWNPEYGVKQKQEDGSIYKGSILEHILLEQLLAFYEVGDNGHIRLRGADWNDALDMAWEHGESVAFTSAYSGNLKNLAEILRELEKSSGIKEVPLMEEIAVLLKENKSDYDTIEKKHEILNSFLEKCRHSVSGKKTDISIAELAKDLEQMSEWIKEHIRQTEWISGDDEGWFNSYYDNHGRKVEGYFENEVRMMLTGQVFTIMSRTATDEQVKNICRSADRYLYRKEAGGYRLNTDFHEEKYDMGRMFGFAYGEKENGAVFSHMAVMYANALYQRGFVKEGYKALNTLAEHSLDFEISRIYPGVPEYFDAQGRGLYNYLTGAASWFLLTMVTEVYGVKGVYGDLKIAPKLMKEQFDENGLAGIKLSFAGHRFDISISGGKDFGDYKIKSARLDKKELALENGELLIGKELIKGLDASVHSIELTLE